MIMVCGFESRNNCVVRQIVTLGPVGQVIQQKLTAALAPTDLQVIDESHQHAGHAGAHPSGESHFRVKVSSHAFAGKPRVQQHRMVNEALREEMASRVHALAIETSAP
jgi:BolA family transcriptional regulator, general stress-responsive regulator